MNNKEIAEVFEEIGQLLELQDANPFKIRAYRRAAVSVQGLSEDVSDVAKRGELKKIPGIGADLEKKIQEFIDTGKVRYLAELHKEIPDFLIEMVRIPGVGPKTARRIYSKFKPKNLERLERLILSGKLRGMPGIKAKTEEKILSGIDLLKRHRGRMPLGKALPLARSIIKELKKLKPVQQISYAGSVRRMCETIGDLDILITASKSKIIMDYFVHMKDVDQVNAHGETKSSVVMKSGLQVDLRVVRPESFGAALLYFTGSKAHNIQLRLLAKKKKMKINEYGLFYSKSGKKIAGKTEKEMYQALGMKYILPELRED